MTCRPIEIKKNMYGWKLTVNPSPDKTLLMSSLLWYLCSKKRHADESYSVHDAQRLLSMRLHRLVRSLQYFARSGAKQSSAKSTGMSQYLHAHPRVLDGRPHFGFVPKTHSTSAQVRENVATNIFIFDAVFSCGGFKKCSLCFTYIGCSPSTSAWSCRSRLARRRTQSRQSAAAKATNTHIHTQLTTHAHSDMNKHAHLPSMS